MDAIKKAPIQEAATSENGLTCAVVHSDCGEAYDYDTTNKTTVVVRNAAYDEISIYHAIASVYDAFAIHHSRFQLARDLIELAQAVV